jgi:trans-aconitate methyltransferase
MDWLSILGQELAAKVRPETASKYLRNNFLRQYVISDFLKQILKAVEQSRAGSVLDLGCGEGLVDYYLLNSLPQLKLIGADQDQQALEVARALNPCAQYQQLDARHTGWAEGSFDLVMANEVLEHLEDYHLVIQEAARVTKNFFLVSVPEWPFYQGTNFLIGANWKTWGEHPDHVVSFTQEKLQSALKPHFPGSCTWKRAFPWLLVLARRF